MSDLTAYELAREAARSAQEKKAEELEILDMRDVSSMADYFVICHGQSGLQVRAIGEQVEEGLLRKGVRVWQKEGFDSLHWVVLDYVDVIVHVFSEEKREFYRLDRLWGDARIEKVKDEVS